MRARFLRAAPSYHGLSFFFLVHFSSFFLERRKKNERKKYLVLILLKTPVFHKHQFKYNFFARLPYKHQFAECVHKN
jgi:hypothetical protein